MIVLIQNETNSKFRMVKPLSNVIISKFLILCSNSATVPTTKGNIDGRRENQICSMIHGTIQIKNKQEGGGVLNTGTDFRLFNC